MDELIDISAARALISDDVLWPRIRDFLWNFAPKIHSSWLAPLLAPLPSVPSISEEPTASPRLARWFLSELRVEPCFHTFPSNDGSRLLLLSPSNLLSLASWLGALASASALRRVTRGPDVAALKTAFPGIYPALFSYTAYFAKTGILDTSDETAPDAILSNGCAILFDALSPLPTPLLHRLRLEFPSDATDSLDVPPFDRLPVLPAATSPSDSPKKHPTLPPSNLQTIKLLLKFHYPEAYSLCFS